jgi:hypothetical protein
MINGPGRQIGNLTARRIDSRRAWRIVESQQRIGVGNVQVVADQSHSKRRMQVVEENRADVSLAVTVCISQQAYSICTGYCCSGSFHHSFHEPAAQPGCILRPGRRIGFGDEHVAIRQYINPSRVIQLAGKGGYGEAHRRRGRQVSLPANSWRDVDHWQE